jgi:3-phosphoshikimate 1-carboxyvinyltransferase
VVVGAIEILRSGPVRGAVRVPGSKSITQRALLVAALADGESVLENTLVADDSKLLLDALRALSVPVSREEADEGIRIRGTAGRLGACEQPLFVGNAGTAMRFLVPILALGSGPYRIGGDARMEERPIGDLVEAVRALGAEVRFEKREGFPPLWVAGGGLRGGRARLRAELSSQYLSAILLAAPYAASPVAVEIEGPLVSRPYVDLTIDVQRDFGVEVEREGDRTFRVAAPSAYRARRYAVEGDWSSASYFLAAAAITGGEVTALGLRPDSLQADARFADLLERMGAAILRRPDGVTVRGGRLRAIDADLSDMPDVSPTLAAVAAAASGTTRVRGVAHLRVKESDRIAVITTELRRLGIAAAAHPDGFEVTGGPVRGGEVDPHGDHRIAMSFAVLGLATGGVRLRDVACVSKSYPGFFADLERLRG